MRFIGAVAAIVLIRLAARSIPLTAQAARRWSRALVRRRLRQARSLATRTPMLWQPAATSWGACRSSASSRSATRYPPTGSKGCPTGRGRALPRQRARQQQPEIEERPAYYRGLLVDRFKLAAHIEKRDMDVYTLTLARNDGKLGPGLRRSDVNCDQAIAESRKRNLAGERLVAPAPGVRPTCGAVGGVASITGGAAELAPFIGMLAGALGRPVVDKTGLTGRFDIDFQAAPPARSRSPRDPARRTAAGLHRRRRPARSQAAHGPWSRRGAPDRSPRDADRELKAT